MNKLGILTRDCAGVNAAIRAVVRSAVQEGLEVFGIMRGYEGLIEGEVVPLDRRSVSGIINRGGTILKTTRCSRFFSEEGQKKAVDTIKTLGLDGLIVIGGNGSLTGAHILADRYGIPVVGIPATIDNDINGVNLTIGADTAVNVAVEALDKIRDTAMSLERIFVVEVMGRKNGYLALQTALAGGCEEAVIPERVTDISEICEEIAKGYSQGKISWIVIVAEGAARGEDIAAVISERTGLQTRVAVLGHIQRGGRPTASDRILASRLGNYAVRIFLAGGTDLCVRFNNDVLDTLPLAEAVGKKHWQVSEIYGLIRLLT